MLPLNMKEIAERLLQEANVTMNGYKQGVQALYSALLEAQEAATEPVKEEGTSE